MVIMCPLRPTGTLIYSAIALLFLWQPTGHWFSCQMGDCHWSPSVAKTDEDQRQPMCFYAKSFGLICMYKDGENGGP